MKLNKKHFLYLIILIIIASVIAIVPNPGHSVTQVEFGRMIFRDTSSYDGNNPQITNDGGSYNTLMFVGKGTSPNRKVQIIDDLSISDDLLVLGNLYQGGIGDGNKVCLKDGTNCPAFIISDTRCDSSGTCSQVCIGSNCKSDWPSSTCDQPNNCPQVCINNDCRNKWMDVDLHSPVYKSCSAVADGTCTATCSSGDAMTEWHCTGGYKVCNQGASSGTVYCEQYYSCGGYGYCNENQ
ncbi:hypothetical protein D6745_03395 [Candidatus Woesearchaeota archaeon]|nr:MAG: hypothetical protein D6745_03395 [Candidatus Woesearchaeota archaeon]